MMAPRSAAPYQVEPAQTLWAAHDGRACVLALSSECSTYMFDRLHVMLIVCLIQAVLT